MTRYLKDSIGWWIIIFGLFAVAHYADSRDPVVCYKDGKPIP